MAFPNTSERLEKTCSQSRVKKSSLKSFQGLSITKTHIVKALRKSKLESAKPSFWRSEELLSFIKKLREIAKPR